MKDSRHEKVAGILVDYSTKVKKNDFVQIVGHSAADSLMLEVYKLCLLRGAIPVIHASIPGSAFLFYKHAQPHQINYFPRISWEEIRQTDVYISLSADYNTREFTNIDPAKMTSRAKVVKRISDWRVQNTRWCIFDSPTHALAQDAGMSLDEYEDFVYNSTLIDWEEFAKELHRLAGIVNSTKDVRIIGKDTELSFSIRGMNCVPGDGRYNMPDGEVFTAPVKNSVNGRVFFDLPANYNGNEVEGIYLEFKDGRCVLARAEKNEKFLLGMLDQDAGSRFIGEFGIGCNYNIQQFTKNILFDEKIGGTVHLAMGQSYKECRGKNTSALHWDMIKDLRKNGTVMFGNNVFESAGRIVM
ncbi:aminopeptidase [Candidatus Woesearchaeota archaeon]|nr:aminopeptidase [Candidatus Woesearchaeota archaeon]